jgi:hypothetical protein
MSHNDFAGKVEERIIAEAQCRGIPNVAAILLTADTTGLSDKRLTSAQAKGLAVQLIHENKIDVVAPQNAPA